jgi:hypothetical protein
VLQKPTKEDLSAVVNVAAERSGSVELPSFGEALKDECLSILAACQFDYDFIGEKIMLC